MNNRQITVPLVTRSGLHVGAGYGDAVTDAFVRQDAQGQPVIPGTSLAGALRALATRLAPRLDLPSDPKVCKALDRDNDDGQPCGCIVCKLFGDVNPGDPSRETEGIEQATAARLWIYDAYPPGSAAGWIRDGVGIDRASRAAYRQGRIKFDLEVLPPGTKFTLRLELQAPDDSTDEQAEEQLLAAVLSEWAAGRGTLGGRVSRGLGAIQIQNGPPVEYRRFDFKDPADLFTYLAEDDPWPKAATDPGWLGRRLQEIVEARGMLPFSGDLPVARSWVKFSATVQATGPFLVNSPVTAAESSFDHAPYLSAGQRDKPLLPGSSLKGALRSQAERIARTLVTRAVYEETPQAERAVAFLERCPACSPVVGEAGEPLASCDALLKGLPEGAAIVPTTDEVGDEHLCLACRLFGSSRRGSRLRVEDAPLIGSPTYKARDFLAIDRFTGGGADAFKFDAAVLWQPRFEVTMFLENPEQWELGWLLLVLRDVHEGLVPLGFGAAKGFGQVKVEKWQAQVGYLDPTDATYLEIPAEGQRETRGLYTVVDIAAANTIRWKDIAQAWVQRFGETVKHFERDKSDKPSRLPSLQKDTYFGKEAEELYSVKETPHE